MPRARCDVEYNGSAATRAREFARDTLRVWRLDEVCLEAEIVTTELVTNAVLHGEPPISLELSYHDDLLRISVADYSVAPPVPGRPLTDAMTGRGLALVAAIAAQWGVAASEDDLGKQVWAEFSTARPTDGIDGRPTVDVEELLDRWGESITDAKGEPRYTVVLGEVPTDLLLAAKAHVDNIVRELTLASSQSSAGSSSRMPGQLGGKLAELLRDVVIGFSEARQSIKRQALAAAARGEERTRLTLTVGASLAGAGERYLAALDDVDEFARAARLLTVESPPEHRAFRRWYVQSLVDQLRAKARGAQPPPPATFERFLLGEVATIASAQRISNRAARLQRVTAALAGALTPVDVARVTVAECVATVGARDGGLVLRDAAHRLILAGGIGTIWPEPAREAVEQSLASARAVWVDNSAGRSGGDGGDRQGSAALGDAPAVATLCAVPLAVAGQVIGALALSFEGRQLFDADDRAFLEAVAAEAAQTLTRTRLHEEQVELAGRLARLQSVAAELGRRSDLAGVCEAAVRHATAAVGATIGAVCLPTSDGLRLRLVETLGGDADEQDRWREFPIEAAVPASEAFRTARPVVIDERTRNLPQFVDFPLVGHPLVCLPLRIDDEVRGVLTLSFADDRRLGAADIDFLSALADVCAQAFGRVNALSDANQVSERFAFLAEASRQLAASLNYEETLQAVADLAVTRLADWCGIELLEGTELAPVAVAHADPEKAAAASLLRARYPECGGGASAGVSGVVASGESRLVTGITDDMLQAVALDDRHVEMLRALGMSSVLIVPLLAGGRAIGALSLVRADPARSFSDGDVRLAEDLGGRAGAAVENARLFREVQASRHSDTGTSHARLDLALAAASIGSFDWDLSTGALTCDSRLCEILGIDVAEFDGNGAAVLDTIVADDRAHFDATLQHAIAYLTDFGVEYRIRRADGSLRWVDSRGRVLPGPDGRAVRVIGIAFDSTEVREARDRVARTLEHMADAFFSLDVEWRFTYVNAAAERLLGKERGLLLGNSIWDQFPELVGSADERVYRSAREDQVPVTFERYIEATCQHFEVRAQPIPEGLAVYLTDISQSRQFERERAELREASRHARSEADVARSRLAFVAEVSADITTTLDAAEVCQRLATHAVGRLADWVSIYIVEGSQCHRVAAAHRDPRWAKTAATLVDAFPIDLSSNAMVARAARTGVPVLEQHMTEDLIAETYPAEEGRALVDGMGVASAFVTPMIARGEVVGVIALIRAEFGNQFDPDELRLAVTLASRAALAVQNARLYTRQTTVVEALQQAVLPEALPVIDGVALSARYEPALGGAGVGGDFYDVFRLPSGRVALAVGDAAGHGLQAGALMGQLRNALRAYAVQEQGPAATLRSLSGLIAGLEPDAFATAFYAELDPATGELGWASAGHPPPLLTFHGEPPRYLQGLVSPPLGVFGKAGAGGEFGGTLMMPPGSGILMYTDGLVERRLADISDGLASLRALASDLSGAEISVDAIVHGMREETGYIDDVCVLFAVRSA